MKLQSLGLFTLIALCSACSSDAKPRPKAADPVVRQAPPAPPAAEAPPAKASALAVSADIREACGLAEPQAYFAYNSAKVRPQDKTYLKELVRCFTTGPLQERRVQLVGHADPRGSAEYNFALGKHRADSVKTALVSLGMPAAKLATESRGKLDAMGRDEASWAKDRRVEASLQ